MYNKLIALEQLYNTVYYKMVLDIRQFKGGPEIVLSKQKYIDYIEK